MKSPGELLECLGLAELCTLLNEGVLEVGPALQHLILLAVNVGRGALLRGDQLVGKSLQRLDLLLMVADGLVKVLVLLDHHLNLLFLAVNVVSVEEGLAVCHPVLSLLAVPKITMCQ